MDKVIEHIKDSNDCLDCYHLYHFVIQLLGGNEFPFHCPAKNDDTAWATVGIQASKYNMPCIRISYVGKD